MLLFLTCVGGCTGSTAGGIKMLRFELLFAFVHNQILRLCRPRGVFPMTYRGRPLAQEVLRSAMPFFFLFLASFVVLALALAAVGLDRLTALRRAVPAPAPVGPGPGGTPT